MLLKNFKAVTLFFLIVSIVVVSSCSDKNGIDLEISKYPDGKDFAFTITEDPDYSTMTDREVVYAFLNQIGIKTTSAVWVLSNRHGSGKSGGATNTRGVTVEDNKEYLKLLLELQADGFEICLHTVSPGNDLREETILGYEKFKQYFGTYPVININHATNLENIYWGNQRFSNRFIKFLYGFYDHRFEGHSEDSKYFWGDICKSKTKYVRAWATNDINTLSVNKSMPYHLSDKPYVNYWFGCSDGHNSEKFKNLISDQNIEKLVRERGTSIIYTHFAYGFVDDGGNLDPLFINQMEKISRKDGWFVPASKILDRFSSLRNLKILNENGYSLIINSADTKISGLTVLTSNDKLFFSNTGQWKSPNNQGEIIIGDIPAFSSIKIGLNNETFSQINPSFFENIYMVLGWLIGRF